MATSDRTEHIRDLLNRNGRWIEVADAKAGVVIVFATALAQQVTGPALGKAALLIPAAYRTARAEEIVAVLVYVLLLTVTAALSGLALLDSFRALTPRLTRKRETRHAYFGDIAASSHDKLVEYFAEASDNEIRHDLIEQVQTTAEIADIKFRRASRAIKAVAFSVPFAIALSASTPASFP